MRYLRHLLRTKGLSKLPRRSGQLLQRFGLFTPDKIGACLRDFVALTAEFGCTPTLCVTAVLLERYPAVFKELADRAELAIHGYTHVDLRNLSPQELAEQFTRARAAFERCGLPVDGFRAPYLSWNGEAGDLLQAHHLTCSSNKVFDWEVLSRHELTPSQAEDINRLYRFYDIWTARRNPSLPYCNQQSVEVPISIPDDELLIDRLGLGEEQVFSVWREAFQKSYARGELFSLLCHPERVPHYRAALRRLLAEVRRASPGVWVAPLRDIAAWWRHRASFAFQISPSANGVCRVAAACSPEARVLVHEGGLAQRLAPWEGKSVLNGPGTFELRTGGKKPLIGLAPDVNPALKAILHQEGFRCEVSRDASQFALYCDASVPPKHDVLWERIQAASSPLLRFWRWPGEARSALAVTQDVDALVLVDFVYRAYEFGSAPEGRHEHQSCRPPS